MTSAALVALSSRIATNTLTLSDQTALTTALNLVALTFQSPDETSFVVGSDEGEAREWIAALYTIAAGGGSGGLVPVSQGTIVVANSTNLSGTNVAGLLNGQPAVVETFGAEFTLQPIGSLVVDGATVLASTDPTRVWERGDTVIAESAALQLDWYVDPVAGSDENTGAIGQPLKTKAEIMRRWGAWWPTLNGINVTIHYLASETTGGDPGLFEPNFVNGARLLHTAALPVASFQGSLNVVTPKNRATNQPLVVTFNTISGAPAIGQLLINSTHPSAAWIVGSPGPGQFLISQPLAQYIPGADATTPTEVDTWTTADAIGGFGPLIAVDLARIGGVTPEFAAGNAPQHIIQHIQIVDPSATESAIEIGGPGNVAIAESFIGRAQSINSTWAFTTILNSVTAANVAAQTSIPDNLSYRGGFCGSAGVSIAGNGALFDQDFISFGGALQGENLQAGFVFLDTGARFLPTGGTSAGVKLYGPGGLTVLGTYEYPSPASGPTGALPLSGPILIGGSNQAYSNLTTAGLTAVHLLSLTAAHLDAAAGATGFGGLAYVPGVGAITVGNATP